MKLKTALKTKNSLELMKNSVPPIDLSKLGDIPEKNRAKLLNEFYKGSEKLQNQIDRIDKEFNLKIDKTQRKWKHF